MRVVRRGRATRLLEGDAVLSVLPDEPGATNSPFDVLACALAALSPGARLLMLGFAAGGVVAPLRALGHDTSIDAVDLDGAGLRVFQEVSAGWAGEVRFERADAGAFLAASRGRWDAVLEDLSIPERGTITKPALSYGSLPRRIAERLARPGILVTNLLPVEGMSWAELIARVGAPFARVLVGSFDEWDNRVLIAGDALPEASSASRAIRRCLDELGSRGGTGFRLSTLKR